MEFQLNLNNPFVETISIFKEDDSPQQQINEQSITEDLEKTRDCKLIEVSKRKKIFNE